MYVDSRISDASCPGFRTRDSSAPPTRRRESIAIRHRNCVHLCVVGNQSVEWRNHESYIRLRDIDMPVMVVEGVRIVDASPAVRGLMTRHDLPCDAGEQLPVSLIAELRDARSGEAIAWRPRGEHGPTLGITRYRLGDQHQVLLISEITINHRSISQRLHHQRLLETGKLLAYIAHELRAPLASIVYNSDVLGMPGGVRGDDDYAQLVEEIQLAAEHLRRTVGGLLDYVRLSPVSTTITLREMWDRVASLLRPLFRAGQHQIEVDLHAPDLLLRANPTTIEQIFINLIVNSIEASGKPARVRVSTRPMPADRRRMWQADEVVLVTVQDDGPGIPVECRASVFEAFVTTKPNGTGLGLTLAREAADSLGGYLELEDSPVGCRFAIALPIDTSASRSIDATAATPRTTPLG